MAQSRIFSGDYSRDMWDEINNAKTKDELQSALYFVCCRLQEFESRVTKRRFLDNVSPWFGVVFLLGLIVGLLAGRL